MMRRCSCSALVPSPRVLLVLALCCTLEPPITSAADPNITSVSVTETGQIQVLTATHGDCYYVLFKGYTSTDIKTPIHLQMGTGEEVVLLDPGLMSEHHAAFYRLAEVTNARPLDSDEDGLDDLYELNNPSWLSPINPADALEDPDGDGRNNLWERRQRTQPGTFDYPIRSMIDRRVRTIVALQRDGTIWQSNPQGIKQLGTKPGYVSVDVADEGGIVTAIHADGTLWAWGKLASDIPEYSGQVGSESNWTMAAANAVHAIALRDDGTLWGWGYNLDGSLGVGPDEFGDYHNVLTPVQLGTGSDWVFINVATDQKAAIKSDGTLWLGGPPFTLFSGDTDWIKVSLRGNYADQNSTHHNLALKRDGRLFAWGFNGFGQLGDGTTTRSPQPVRVGADSDWVDMATEDARSLGLKSDGTLWSWGFDLWYRGASLVPQQLGDKSNWIALTGQAAVDTDNILWSWAVGSWQTYNTPTLFATSQPSRVSPETDWTQVEVSMAIKQDGTLWAWGGNQVYWWNPAASTGLNPPVQVVSDQPWASVSVGSGHAIAIKADGSLWGWGYNGSGQLGDDGSVDRRTPVQAGPDHDWQQVWTRYSHNVAKKTDGTLWGWGDNTSGQVGAGPIGTHVRSPQQIGTATDWTDVSPGWTHTLAVNADGSLWGWGANDQRQLALTPTLLSSTNRPTQLGSGTDWARVAAGLNYSLAIKTNGTLWMWGRGAAPAQIDSDSDWAQVQAGDFALLLKENGTMWGGLFAGAPEGTSDLLRIFNPGVNLMSSDTDWVQASPGSYWNVVARKADGSIWSWGWNTRGGLALPLDLLPLPIGQPVWGWP